MYNSTANLNDNKISLDKMHSKSFPNETKSLNSTPTKSSFKFTSGQRLSHKNLSSFFGTSLCATFSTDSFKNNTTPVRCNSIVEKKSTSFDATTHNNIFCRRYKSSYYETRNSAANHMKITENNSFSPARPQQQQQECCNFKHHNNALALNELEIRSSEAKSVVTSSSSTSKTLVSAGNTNKTVTIKEGASIKSCTAAAGVVSTKQAVDLLQQKRQQFSAKPKVFFKFALPDEFIPCRR